MDDKQARIRSVFLGRKNSYDLPEVAHLTGIPAARLRRQVRTGDHDAVKVGGAWRFTWRQVACIALQSWTLVEIHAALGCDAGAVLPPLLSLRAVTVQLPEFVVRALETIASEERTTLDAALHGELIDLAGTMSERMEGIAPGYRRAYLFPGMD